MMPQKVKMYTLSTCSHCKATKKFMADNNIDFDFVDVDLVEGEEKEKIIEEIVKINPNRAFPCIVVGDKIIIDFQEKAIREALGI